MTTVASLLGSNNDFVYVNGRRALVTGVDLVKQRIGVRMRSMLGEYVIDTTDGVPYIQEIFKKGTTRRRIQEIFRDVVLATEGVSSILDIAIGTFDSKTRLLSGTEIKAIIADEFGEEQVATFKFGSDLYNIGTPGNIETSTLPSAYTPFDYSIKYPHAPTHQLGGSDVINVAGLSGVLADEQDAGELKGAAIESGTPLNGEHMVFNTSSGEWEYASVRYGSATDNAITRWHGDDSETFQGSTVTLSDGGNIANVTTLHFGTWPTIAEVSGAAPISFSIYQKATLQLNNAATVTITLPTPGIGNFMLKIIQGDTTPATTINWSASKPIYVPVGGLVHNSNVDGVTVLGIAYDGIAFSIVANPMVLLT